MFESNPPAVLEFLREQRLPGSAYADLEQAHLHTGKPPALLAIEAGLFTRPALLGAVADYCGCPFVSRAAGGPDPEALRLLDGNVARRCRAVPWRAGDQSVTVWIADPFRAHLAEELAQALGVKADLCLADPAEMVELVQRHYGEGRGRTNSPEFPAAPFLPPSPAQGESGAAGVPGDVSHLVDTLLVEAVRERASDIHFEPFEDTFVVRFRVDGALRTVATPELALATPVISRLKVMADLNIAERRVPQDGRLRVEANGRSVALRLSTLPTQFGESVVLRVLDSEAARLGLEDLGLPASVLSGVLTAIRRPNGLFLVTGPTGSGKTTTLYGALRTLNQIERKILTVEDPVEYELEGVMQVGVHPGIGRTFAATLRAMLRQDPDVILVGEIRDEETARVAIQAALTGHLVLATLHTNDAAGAIVRLADMGVEPYLVASALSGVLAQRLVRRLCRTCRVERPLGELEKRRLAFDASGELPDRCHEVRGCASCAATGYRGRFGLYEWLPITPGLRDLIAEGSPTRKLRDTARSEGMTTLRQAGLQAIREGATTVDEVLLYT